MAAPALHAQRPERPQAPPVPPSVAAMPDLPYAGTDNKRQQLDLYLPKTREAGKTLPVLVFIHGGAWLAGDKSQGRGQIFRAVAEGKAAGVSIVQETCRCGVAAGEAARGQTRLPRGILAVANQVY